MTLVELMVTIGLMSTVIAIVAGGLVTATSLMGSNSLRLQEISQNKVAIEAMTKTMRTAVEPRLLGSASDAAAFIQGDSRSVSLTQPCPRWWRRPEVGRLAMARCGSHTR